MSLRQSLGSKLFLAWLALLVIGVGLQMANIPAGSTLLSIIVGIPFLVGIVVAIVSR